ncbi:reverse transcriptase domain-containing protein [Tanacetum coccineum]
MSEAAINPLIAQRMADALAEYETNQSSGNGNDNGNGIYDSGKHSRRTSYLAREWNLYSISATAQWNARTLMKMMTDKYCPRSEIKKLEIALWNLKVKGTDVVRYAQRFQELALMYGRMLLRESDQVEKYVGGLPNNIQENVMSAKPKMIQEACGNRRVGVEGMRKSSSLALRIFIEQSHDEVYGCLKGGSINSGGKRLAISYGLKEAVVE